jgi:hypothetical protein
VQDVRCGHEYGDPHEEEDGRRIPIPEGLHRPHVAAVRGAKTDGEREGGDLLHDLEPPDPGRRVRICPAARGLPRETVDGPGLPG